MSINELYQIFINSSGIATDTRKVNKGMLFFALKGERFNGNDFALEAISRGAIAAIVDEDIEGEKLIRVDDSLKALQNLANHHRNQHDIPVIGLTGSNGKTTTKELLANILTQKYEVVYTQGNLNNHIGVPLSLFQITESTEIAIIEMGANHLWEIDKLCQIAEPSHGLITNIGTAHLEGFGSLEGIKKGKLELFDHIRRTEGVFFLNNEDENLKNLVEGNLIPFGTFENISSSKFPLEFIVEGNLVRSYLFGKYNLGNIHAAETIGRFFEVDLLDRIYGIESYYPKNNRSQIVKMGSNTILLDAYNANPSSMRESINNFAELEGDKMVILGSMKELGEYSQEEHQKLIKVLESRGLKDCYLVGNEFDLVEIPKSFSKYRDIHELKKIKNLHQQENKLILLKGSRSNKIESYIT